MIMWRIANKNYADLSGIGGIYCSGRWHKQGLPIVYFAEHPALAMLEVRVNMDLEKKYLADFVMMKITIPDKIKIHKIDDDPSNENICQIIGSKWLKGKKTLLAKVKSAISPESYNYLFNPIHKDASKVKIIDIKPFAFDARLFD